MLRIIIFLAILGPINSKAYRVWTFSDLSFSVGQQYRFSQNPLQSYEIQYDKYFSGCRGAKYYRGIGLNYSHNKHQTEHGVKLMWNPTHLLLAISRNSKLFPYLYGQGNFNQTKLIDPTTTNPKNKNSFSLRPGFGVTGYFKVSKLLSIRTYLQMGYHLQSNILQNFKNSLTLELKVGIGINTNQFRIKRR